jgi:hypothetical protein
MNKRLLGAVKASLDELTSGFHARLDYQTPSILG